MSQHANSDPSRRRWLAATSITGGAGVVAAAVPFAASMAPSERARAAGVPVRLEIYPRMWHVWQVFPALPEARQSLDDIAQFLSSHLPRSE